MPTKLISPCLWFDDQAEAAVAFYTGIFPNSRVIETSYYSEAGQAVHKRPPGSVMTISFVLDGQPFTALNGGPVFTFNEAVSFEINCETAQEADHYWEKLSEGGDPAAQQCGWLKDRFGLSWQIVPRRLVELLKDPDRATRDRVMESMLRMKKIDMAEIERAAAGG